MRRIACVFAALLMSLMLGGCRIVRVEGESTPTVPDMRLLEMEKYAGGDDYQSGVEAGAQDYYLIDLWLDATQVAGGINTTADSIFPHYANRYREGGFHYRLSGQTGRYESVLNDMLLASGDMRVRLLRYGNEILTDGFLTSQGLLLPGDTDEKKRSLRRDMMTYAIDPKRGVFDGMSAENMTGSFYSLGTPMLNGLSAFTSAQAKQLENPELISGMSRALDRQISGIAYEEPGYVISGDDHTCPLLYALEAMDYSRLNVITVDPAAIRQTSGTDASGRIVRYYEELLSGLEVLSGKGLSVGIMAMTLDYMGQISAIGTAELKEPLIWGKPIYNSDKRVIEYAAVMPRIMLALIIGENERVTGYMDALCRLLDADESLRGERGPKKNALSYTENGKTVYQQPFAFAYERAVISRPRLGYYTQNTPGAALAVISGQGAVTSRSGLNTAVLSPNAQGAQEDRTLEITIPLPESAEYIDPSRLKPPSLATVTTLLFSGTVENTGETPEAREGEQYLTLRDKTYIYEKTDAPRGGAPFSIESYALTPGNAGVRLTISVRGDSLTEGYYRLRADASIDGGVVTWDEIPWIDGADGISHTISSAEVYEWERFSGYVWEKERRRTSISRILQHAWGPYDGKDYYGMAVPDCPPVYKAFSLRELTAQIRASAGESERPFIKYVFDVFVSNVQAD